MSPRRARTDTSWKSPSVAPPQQGVTKKEGDLDPVRRETKGPRPIRYNQRNTLRSPEMKMWRRDGVPIAAENHTWSRVCGPSPASGGHPESSLILINRSECRVGAHQPHHCEPKSLDNRNPEGEATNMHLTIAEGRSIEG